MWASSSVDEDAAASLWAASDDVPGDTCFRPFLTLFNDKAESRPLNGMVWRRKDECACQRRQRYKHVDLGREVFRLGISQKPAVVGNGTISFVGVCFA